MTKAGKMTDTRNHIKHFAGLITILFGYLLTACTPITNIPVETNTPSSVASPSPAPTLEPTLTNTPTPQLYTISFQAFHDYDGDGAKDQGEPALEGILIKIDAGECKTNAYGNCDILGVPAGNHAISVTDTRNIDTALKMRYLLLSTSEVKPIADGLQTTINGNELIPIPLGQGFLTWPSDSEHLGSIGCFMDRLAGPGCVDWINDPSVCADEHIWGIDIRYTEGSLVLAAAPGYVMGSTEMSVENFGVGLLLTFNDTTSNGELIEYNLDYSHLKQVLLTDAQLKGNQIINRGDPIGYTGTFGSYPHLHFGFYAFTRPISGVDKGKAIPLVGQPFITVDPYAIDGEGGYWISRNSPFPPY